MTLNAGTTLASHHRLALDMTMPQMLDHAAATWPERRALHFVDTGEVRTYEQVRDQVTRVRSALESLGLRRGDKVGLMLRNQIEFPLAWLAVVEAGAVSVPINPKYTRREVDFVAADAEVAWMVVADDLLDDVLAGEPPVGLDRLVVAGASRGGVRTFEDLVRYEPTPRRFEADRRDLVGIQFTSGTTGLPKGCMLTHEYWVDLGVYAAAFFEDPQSFLADHPFYYMQNQAYFMMAMAGGGQLHVTPGLSRSKFMRWLVDLEIDYAWIDDGMLSLPASDLDHRLALKLAPIAAVPRTLHRPLEDRFGLKAREWYASTEVGSGLLVPKDRDDLVGSGSMGVCAPGRESKIVDGSLEEVPPGVVGELCLRGPGMMLGYWNRPDANEELLLPGGWFRTGDLVRKDEEGLHYYIGRTRDVVRRSGENIAAVEVENHLVSLGGVAEAAVVPVPDQDRGEEVKAIIVLEPGADVTASALIEWARSGLAAFKVPRYIEFRSDLPHTASGKVHKARLREEEPFGPTIIDMKEAHV